MRCLTFVDKNYTDNSKLDASYFSADWFEIVI